MANRTVANLTAVLSMNNSKFKKGVSGSQKTLKGFQKQVMNLGGTIAAAFSVRAITNFTKESFRALDVQMKAERSLLTALNGRVLAQQKLIEQARNLQKVTLYGDEETIRAQALIATMVKEEETIKRLMPLVQDFATAKNMQLGAAADLVAKSIGSSTNALSRYGITITGAVGSSERLETAVLALNKAFGGQAKAAAEADVLMTQIKNSWGDFQESFAAWANEGGGSFLMRGVKGGLDDLSKLFSPQNAEAMEKFKGFMESIKDHEPARQAEMLADEIERQKKAVSDLAKERRKWQKDLDERGVLGGGRVAKLEIQQIDEKQNALIEVLRVYEAQAQAINNIGDGIDDVITKLPALKTVAGHILPEGFDAAFGPGGGVLQGMFTGTDPTKDITAAYDAQFNALRELSAGLDEYASGLDTAFGEESFGKVDKLQAPVNELGKMIGMSLVSQFDQLGVAIGQFASGAEGAFNSLGDAIMQNLGNILIMMGAQTGNLPLVLLGAGLQLGGGLLRGLGNKKANTQTANSYAGSAVEFKIQGKDLVGTMQRQNYSNYMNT
jgi:hypothetical protein